MRKASSATSVRNVTSAHPNPASHNSFAKGSASSKWFSTTTGTIPISPICSTTGFVFFNTFRTAPGFSIICTNKSQTLSISPAFLKSIPKISVLLKITSATFLNCSFELVPISIPSMIVRSSGSIGSGLSSN